MQHLMAVEKLFRMEASHRLPKHTGKCFNLHGHSWRIKVAITGHMSPATGMVIDFSELSALVKPVVEFLDHKHLNWFFRNPTSETMTEFFTLLLAPLPVIVSVSETENSWAFSAGVTLRGHGRMSERVQQIMAFLPEGDTPEFHASIDYGPYMPVSHKDMVEHWGLIVGTAVVEALKMARLPASKGTNE